MLSLIVYTLSHTFGVVELLRINPQPRAVDAGESRWQRSVTDRGEEGRERGSDNQREKYRSVTLTTTHQLHHYTVRHAHARAHIRNQMHKVSENSQLCQTK